MQTYTREDELRGLATFANVFVVIMALLAVGLTALGVAMKSIVLPIEAVAAFGGAAFAMTVKQFALGPTSDLRREARRWLLLVAIVWAAAFVISALIHFAVLNLLDAVVWLPILFFMQRTVRAMGRVVSSSL